MNTSPFGVRLGGSVLAPRTLVVVELLNIAIDLQRPFWGTLAAFCNIDRICIWRFNDAQSSPTKGCMVLPIRLVVQKVTHKSVTDIDVKKAMRTIMKACKEPMLPTAKVAAIICPRLRVNRAQLLRRETCVPYGFQRLISVDPTDN